MTTNNKTKTRDLSTYAGAAIAFVLFLVVGALPGLLYGGYLGLFMANALFGAGELTTVSRLMAGGGMLLGFSAALALFLVVGSVLGAAVGAGAAEIGAVAPVAKEAPEKAKV
jgi:hypothetical protein